jgi:ribosomal protein S18 acetylase RimI-like enzyme
MQARIQALAGPLPAVMAAPAVPPAMLGPRDLERLAQRAWPALEERWLDGWLLRFSQGYTRRANSVAALAVGSLPLTEKIARCQAEYRRRGLPLIFRIAPSSEPPLLDSVLAAAGYRSEAETITQVAPLSALLVTCHPAVHTWSRATDDWLAAYHHCGGIAVDEVPLLRQSLARSTAPSLFVAARVHGEPVSCAMGVLDRGYLGVYSVVTAVGHQRRGYARACINGLARWAAERGGDCAHLQVLAGNQPARRLYARLGFRTAYRYWYRVETPPPCVAAA